MPACRRNNSRKVGQDRPSAYTAFAVEDQRQARLGSLPGALVQQAQLRHDAVPDLAHHAIVHLAVQAQQRRAPPKACTPSSRPAAGRASFWRVTKCLGSWPWPL